MKKWIDMTNDVIKHISANNKDCVYLLLGNYAKSKVKYIDTKKHCVIQGVHPSPLSAYNGFFGSKIFSKTNKYLAENNIQEINWMCN